MFKVGDKLSLRRDPTKTATVTARKLGPWHYVHGNVYIVSIVTNEQVRGSYLQKYKDYELAELYEHTTLRSAADIEALYAQKEP